MENRLRRLDTDYINRPAFDGVETVVDVIQCPNFEQQASTEFFTTVAANLSAVDGFDRRSRRLTW